MELINQLLEGLSEKERTTQLRRMVVEVASLFPDLKFVGPTKTADSVYYQTGKERRDRLSAKIYVKIEAISDPAAYGAHTIEVHVDASHPKETTKMINQIKAAVKKNHADWSLIIGNREDLGAQTLAYVPSGWFE